LVSKFFDNKILRDLFPETSASQGFRRYRNKKISGQIRPGGQNALIAKCSPNFILMEKSTLREGLPIQRRSEEGLLRANS
jgi:hypothetical protein